MSLQHGAIWWSELMTRDVPAALAYYRDTFGWRFERSQTGPGGAYHVALAHGRSVAGIADMTAMPGTEDQPPRWLVYIAVDDVDAATNATAMAGGHVLRHPFEVPGVGRLAVVSDPTGAVLGLMTPAPTGGGEGGAEPDLENVPV